MPSNDVINNFFAGGGKMGELVRTTNWKNTDLGETTKWPMALLHAVSMMLGPHGSSITKGICELINSGQEIY